MMRYWQLDHASVAIGDYAAKAAIASATFGDIVPCPLAATAAHSAPRDQVSGTLEFLRTRRRSPAATLPARSLAPRPSPSIPGDEGDLPCRSSSRRWHSPPHETGAPTPATTFSGSDVAHLSPSLRCDIESSFTSVNPCKGYALPRDKKARRTARRGRTRARFSLRNDATKIVTHIESHAPLAGPSAFR